MKNLSNFFYSLDSAVYIYYSETCLYLFVLCITKPIELSGMFTTEGSGKQRKDIEVLESSGKI